MIRIIPIFIFALLFSCQEPESPKGCAVANPIEDLPWLKELIKENSSLNLIPYFYLIQGSYQGQTVFSFLNCCPFCRTVPQILDCQGNLISNASITEVTDQKVIWKPVESVCN